MPDAAIMTGNRPLDVICIGRSSVDLYGDQVGGRLEDMSSFAKYVGGCPTNISVGAARMGRDRRQGHVDVVDRGVDLHGAPAGV